METLNMSGLTDLGMEDPSFFFDSLSSFHGMEDPSFILNSLDDYSRTASSGESLHHTFSQPIPDLKRSSETYYTGFDRPKKITKTYSWESSITEQLSNKDANFPNLLTFGKSDNHIKQETVIAESLTPFGNQKHVPKAYGAPMRISNACNQDHIIAERKRREKLSQKFIALSALVPGLKKMDKASVLGDATKYLKQLQEQVKALEERTKRKTMESAIFVKRHEIYADDDGSSSDKKFDGDSYDESLPEIEARVCDESVLVRIHCEKRREVVEKTITEMEKHQLSVLSSSVLSFGNYMMDITVIAQMDTGFPVSIKDLVKHLRSIFVSYSSEKKY